MDKGKFIDQQLLKLNQSSLAVLLPYGSLFFILLSALDYFVTPENFKIFFLYRLTFAASGMTLFLIFRLKKNKDSKFLLFTTFTATLIASIMVELMILSFGGHQSIYYAGMIVVLIFILGFLPLSIRMTILINFTVYAVYLIPILLFDTITNSRVFVNNNIFFIASILGSLGWRYFHYNLLIKNLSLEYDLSKEKKRLENYSQRLEQLVQERTKELSISEKWHRSIFDNATDGIIILDKNGVILNVNQRACEIHGFDKNALIGVNASLLESKSDKEEYDKRMSKILGGESLIFETEHYQKDGSRVVLEVSSKAIDIEGETFVQSFYRDVTEKKSIQEQLAHAQKMESVGSLAGGIAHNFNNVLTTILGYADLLLNFSEINEAARQRVRYIESSARKASVTVSKLLSFARREPREIVPLNLNDLVNDSVKLFEGVIEKRIGLKVSLAAEIPIIEGDPNQIEQVLMNLTVNARDAMPDGGLITIKTEVVNVGGNKRDAPSYIAPGRYVVLTVSDTGCGIPKKIRDRIFDPFFTTKEKGKGTGLGLASVYGIVTDHKGYLSVQSEAGQGTSFDIYLPVSGKILRRIAKQQIISVEGSENILLVDDDREVLSLIKDILETHGYRVMAVNNSVTAIDVFKNNADKIQLVITDIVMPLVDGSELIKIFKDIKPDIRIIVVSAYSKEAVKKGDIDFSIRKPFEGIELLTAVRQILDSRKRNLPLY